MPETRPWNPSRAIRNWIGIATLWPPIYFAFFMASMGYVFWLTNEHISNRQFVPDLFKYIFPLHCFTILLSFALTTIYAVHAARSDRLTQEMRIVWILVLFFFNMFAFPVYWWLYLRRTPGGS